MGSIVEKQNCLYFSYYNKRIIVQEYVGTVTDNQIKCHKYKL